MCDEHQDEFVKQHNFFESLETVIERVNFMNFYREIKNVLINKNQINDKVFGILVIVDTMCYHQDVTILHREVCNGNLNNIRYLLEFYGNEINLEK